MGKLYVSITAKQAQAGCGRKLLGLGAVVGILELKMSNIETLDV